MSVRMIRGQHPRGPEEELSMSSHERSVRGEFLIRQVANPSILIFVGGVAKLK